MLMPGGSEGPNSDVIIRDFYEDQKTALRATARNRADADRKVREYEEFIEARRSTLESAQVAQWEREKQEREAKNKAASGESFISNAGGLLGKLWDGIVGNYTGGALSSDSLKKYGKNAVGVSDFDAPKVDIPNFDFEGFKAKSAAASKAAANAELRAAGGGTANYGSGAIAMTKEVKEFSDSFTNGIDKSRIGYTLPNLSLPDFDFMGGAQQVRDFYEL